MEREEEEVEPEQRVEKKHGQEEKQKEVLQALGQRFSRSRCWRQRGTSPHPKGCCSLLRAHTGTGEKWRRKERPSRAVGGLTAIAPVPVWGLTATAPHPCTSHAAGTSRTRA